MTGAVLGICEIAFWVLIALGLGSRYLLGMRRLGLALLIATPLVDLTLLALTVVDLRRGGQANVFHGLAAVYLGVSVAFGHRMIRWADQHFAHRFAAGPRPRRRPSQGVAHARSQRQGWYRHLLAFTIGSGLLLGGIAMVGDGDRTAALSDTIVRWAVVLAFDLAWSFSYTIWPRTGTEA